MSGYDRLKIYQTQVHPCSYLDGRESRSVFIDPATELDRQTSTYLAERGFRRSGDFVYRPNCPTCESCISARIPVQNFQPGRTQRRLLKRNADLTLAIVKPALTDESYRLFADYINIRHADGDMYPPTEEMFQSFLVQTKADTRFMEFRLDDRLVAVAVYDRLENAYSAVYSYFDPELTERSLGTYCILRQAELAREQNLDYLYLGFWVKGCKKMSYKADYRPLELFVNEQWRSLS